MVSFSIDNECITDVYFANGILTKRQVAKDNAEEVLKPAILEDVYGGNIEEFNKHIGKVDYAYNETNGFLFDNLESAFQKFGMQWLIDRYTLIHGEVTSHLKSIAEQITAYKGSIQAGHKVLVVAHSQGNLFTYAAYNALPGWMHNSFEAISIASPMTADIKQGTPRFDWDNDLVPRIASLGDKKKWMIDDPVRKVSWESEPYIGKSVVIPTVDYVWSFQVGQTYKERYKAVEAGLNSAVHAFTFYMGKSLISDKTLNPFDEKTLHINKSKTKIIAAIKSKLNNGNSCSCSNKSVAPVTTQNGAIETTLSWTCANDINMDLTLTGDKVIQDVKDEEGVGLEHAYVASRSDIYPGAVYEASATGEKRQESDLEESYLEDDPINIYAVVKTPGGSKFKQYEAHNFGQLNLGEFAVIEVKDKTIETTYTYRPPSPYTPISIPNPRSYTRTYNECNEEDKKYTCQCVPCEYIIHGMENAVEYGPIGDAYVEVIRADTYGSSSPTVVYRGKTTSESDLFKSGLIKFDQNDYTKFEDDVYYVVDAKGGSDLDRDDNLIMDDIPTVNNGTIHAIIKGSDLKTVAFRVNVLTEAIYQVSGDLLGIHYNKEALDTKLGTASKKLFREKTYIFNNELEINYHDVLLWAPGVDKRKLFKPYDTFVEPIVVKTYADEPRVKESYRLIYEKLDTDAPQLTPLALEIPHTIPNNSIIGIVNIASEGISGIDRIELHGDANATFSINKEGLVKVVDRDTLILDAVYRLDMIAVGIDGKRGISMELLIKIIEGVPLADPNATVPTLESIEVADLIENSPDGTLAAQVNFIDSSLNIVGYNLSGEHNSSFVIDSSGKITVASNADIDYERSDSYNIKVSAINEAGNESFPVAFSIKIINEIDTPLHDLVYLTYLTENVPIGTVVGKIVQLREGRSPITSFDILNPGVPFAIDVNGTIRTTGYINYEESTEYNLLAMAKTDSGNSNRVDLQIIINDVYPETGKPDIQEFTVNIDENLNAGVYVGTLNINEGATPVELVELRGTGSSNFTVDINGTITVANNATLNYEEKNNYSLQAIAHNVNGSSNLSPVNISLNNIEDEPPVLRTLTKSIEENTVADTIIGKLSFSSSGEGNITSFLLTGAGAENFTVDENGTLRVSPMANLDYESVSSYSLLATAYSDVGESEPVSVRIYILNIAEHVPVLEPFAGSVDENATVGTIIGTIEEVVGGDTPLISYTLNNANMFSIDNNGILRLEAPLDYSMRSHYSLEVNATNDAGTSDTVAVNITVFRYFYTGNSSNDHFIGSSRDEKFDTKEGDDFVDAGAGDDTLIGGSGNDVLQGGDGDDVYIYSIGDGADEIYDTGGEDILKFYDPIVQDDVLIERDNNDLLIALKNGDKELNILTDKIRMKNWFNYENRIEYIEFSDGLILGTSDILAIEREVNSEKYLFSDNEHFYYFYNVRSRTWIEAKNFCEERGLYLTTITSLEESMFIENHINNNQNYWLGATDSITERSWGWITGELWDYTNWSRGEPNNSGNEDFLEFYGASHKWNDLANFRLHYPLCEMDNREIMILNVENFEDHAHGWSIVKRESGNELSTFLGRFGKSDGLEEVQKTYHFNSQYAGQEITIAFDMYKIDTWEGNSEEIDKFQVFLNHILVVDDLHAEKSKYGIPTTSNEFDRYGSEWIFHYKLNTVIDENGNVTLGFGSTLDQGISDESYGIDNIVFMIDE